MYMYNCLPETKIMVQKFLLYTCISIYFPVYPVDLSFHGTTSAETIEGKRFNVHCIYVPVHFNIFSIGLTVVGGMDCTIKVWDIRKGVASSSSQ